MTLKLKLLYKAALVCGLGAALLSSPPAAPAAEAQGVCGGRCVFTGGECDEDIVSMMCVLCGGSGFCGGGDCSAWPPGYVAVTCGSLDI